jgi:hypothetical protein
VLIEIFFKMYSGQRFHTLILLYKRLHSILKMSVYSIQQYVIQFVSDLRQVGGFLRFPPPIKLTVESGIKRLTLKCHASSTNKTDRHDITDILLKVALNTINP